MGTARLSGQGQRQEQDQYGTDHANRLNHTIDSAAVVIIGGKRRPPGRLTKCEDRDPSVEHKQPGQQTGEAQPGLSHEEHVDGDHGDGRA